MATSGLYGNTAASVVALPSGSETSTSVPYNDLQSPIRNNPVDNTVPLLKYNNLFTEKAYSPNNLLSKFTSKTDITNMVDVITFNQEKPSSNFSFNYYFNLYFTKI
jgi:hypothetical protein